MSCSRVEAMLSEFVDGELDARAAAEVAEHLRGCESCRAAESELRSMIGGLGRLGSPEPSAFLWSRIEARLDEKPVHSRRWWWWISSATLAAAAVTILFLVGKPHLATAPSDEALLSDARAEFRRAEQHYQQAIADLGQLADRARATWPQGERGRFDDARAALDRATAKCRDAAHAHPDDADAQELLYRAYRQEITFLEDSLLQRAAEDRP